MNETRRARSSLVLIGVAFAIGMINFHRTFVSSFSYQGAAKSPSLTFQTSSCRPLPYSSFSGHNFRVFSPHATATKVRRSSGTKIAPPAFPTYEFTKLQCSATNPSPSEEKPSSLKKIRNCARKLTGISFTSMRAAGRAMTGFSLTTVRLSLRAAMSRQISSLLHWIVGIFPTWLRFIYQPIFMLYYWPLFVIQNLLGSSKESKSEALSTHEALVQGWRDAVQAAEKANMGEMWPIHVTESGQIRLSFPVGDDENTLLRGEFMEFVDTDEVNDANKPGEVVVLDESYEETRDDIRAALVEAVEEAIADEQPARSLHELERVVPPWERHPSDLPKKVDQTLPPNVVQPAGTFQIDSTRLQSQPGTSSKSIATEETSSEIEGPRWAVAAKNCDLSGKWYLLDSEEFKTQYDKYLTCLGQPAIVRSVALSLIGFTREEIIQENDGRTLIINGVNPRGIWNRKLISSGAERNNPNYQPVLTEIYTADSEKVEAEAWWEGNGTVHKSWLRGGMKYGGGNFESSRYLASDNVLICKSVFHPNDPKREKAQVTWRFQREDST